MIGLQPWIGIHEIGLADFPQDGGEENVGDGEIGAGDPFAAVESAFQSIGTRWKQLIRL